jgi:hypothetical protein
VGKRTIVLSLFFLISGLAVLGYFLERNRRDMLTDPYKAIPTDAALVIETADLQEFLNKIAAKEGIFGELNSVKELNSFTLGLRNIVTLVNRPAFENIFTGNKALIAFFYSENNKFSPLLSMVVPSDLKLRQVREILRESGVEEVSEQEIDGGRIMNIKYTHNRQADTAYIFVKSGLLLCCTSMKYLERAVSNDDGRKDIRSIPGFFKVYTASGKNEDRLFAVFSNLSEPVSSLLRKDEKSIAARIGRLAEVVEGDIYINDDGLVLSGYLETPDSTDLLYRYKSILPGTLDTDKVLPSSTILFETVLLPGEEIGTTRNNLISEETYALALELKPYIGEEITRAIIDIREQKYEENTLVIYELSNRMQSENILTDALGKSKSHSTKSGRQNILYFQPDDQTKIPVYRTPFKGLISVLLPSFAPDFNDSYFAFYDNYLVTGNSFATISGFLYENILNKTLANDITYRDFEGTLPSRAGYFFYCIPSRITGYLSAFLDDKIIKILQGNNASLKKIQAAGYLFASSNEMIYNSLSIRFKKEAREESKTQWETLLDTIAGIKPFFFTNHITGAKEIFIQDLKNNAYLINSAGRVLWKVPVKERISGNVFMIDYYRNGKFQLLFAGKNFLHILDRNGNYVERYPVKLRNPAANGLAVFDYDNNRDYRFFIAGDDRIVYAYNKTGSIVKGWKPFKTAFNVISDVRFFRVSGKDYLVVCDESSVYFLDRTGNKRLTLKDVVTKARGSEIRLSAGADPSVVLSSPDGTVQKIKFDGTISKISLRKFSDGHSFDFFDIDGDGFDEYIFIDKGILYLYDHNASEMFTKRFNSDDLGGPITFIFSGADKKIGVFDNKNKLIYLIDKNGETAEGFPLRGASMFSIGRLSEKGGYNLIVGGTDRFLYNYKIGPELK